MRTRQVTPGFWKSDELAEVEPIARLVFIGLWCLADREGVLEYRPARIKAEVLPYDDIPLDVFTSYVNDLFRVGVIRLIQGEKDGHVITLIHIPNFKKHQNIHPHEARSKLPDVAGCHEIHSVPSYSSSSSYISSTDISHKPEEERPTSVSVKCKDISKEVEDLTDSLIRSVSDNGFPVGSRDSWSRDIDKIVRIDGYTHEDVSKAIAWFCGHAFWWKNIRSASKLRKHMAVWKGETGGGPARRSRVDLLSDES